jgi:glycerol-3-phosphate dehydrogenase subunit B
MKAVVVGGGLAGSAAALELAERGVSVTLLRHGSGATAASWGTIDVAVPAPDAIGLPLRDAAHGRSLSPRERLAHCLRARPHHPYATLFGRGAGGAAEATAADAVKRATAALDAWLAPSGLRIDGSLDAHRLLANVRGAVRVADLALSGPSDGDLTTALEVEIALVPGLAHYDPRPLARAVAAELVALGVPRPALRVVPLALPDGFVPTGGALARVTARADTEEGMDALVAAVARRGGRDDRPLRTARGDGERRLLLLPPILGFEGVQGKLVRLREAAGCRVAELMGASPASPAGLRLSHALDAALARRGVTVCAARVVGVERAGRRVTAVRLARERAGDAGAIAAPEVVLERMPAEAVLFATGRFFGGGLVEAESGLVEPILGLPLYDGRGVRVDGTQARRLVRPSPDDAQSLFSSGVRTDARLRPLAADGEAACENVFAAGDLLGGFDPACERTGLGVALLSGLRVADEIARLAEGGAP